MTRFFNPQKIYLLVPCNMITSKKSIPDKVKRFTKKEPLNSPDPCKMGKEKSKPAVHTDTSKTRLPIILDQSNCITSRLFC